MSIASKICDLKYAQRSSPVSISNEEHTVKTSVPYSITLKEKPSKDHDITIPGYTESTSAPTSELEFYVDYDLSIVYFYLIKAGENISVTYYGTGSPVIADDVNRFSGLLDALWVSIYSFRVEALLCGKVRMYGGRFISGTGVYAKKELFIDFCPPGNFAISLSGGYFKRVLIGINTETAEISTVEGVEASKYDAAIIPSFSSYFKPVAIVTVGSDFDISQEDIIPVRNFLI